MVIQVAGPLGLEKAKQLYIENEELIKGRFAGFFVRRFETIAGQETGENAFAGAEYVRQVGENGLYGALWEAGEELGVGMEISNNDIPVRQEIVEILELFDESPYECPSKGSCLVISKKPLPNLAVIGKTTNKKARVIRSSEGERFLTPPSRQNKDIEDRNKGRAQGKSR